MYPCSLHPLLQFWEVGIQGVLCSSKHWAAWPHFPPFSPSSAVLGFSSGAGAVAVWCIAMFWLEVKITLLCMCANWLHWFFNTVLLLAGRNDGWKWDSPVTIAVPCQFGEGRESPKGCLCEIPSLRRINLQSVFSPLKAHRDLDVASINNCCNSGCGDSREVSRLWETRAL